MSSDARTQPAPRARAVAGAPVDALLARTDELARRWAIALVLALPLERIGELPLESFAREAPLLCAQMIRALASDEELERISRATAPGAAARSPAARLAEVTGAADGGALAQAVEALRGVLWEALLDESRPNSTDQSVPAREIADLADRLAYVSSSALVSSLGEPTRPGRRAEQALVSRPRAAGEAAPPPLVPSVLEPAVAHRQRAALGNGVVIVDEGQPPPRQVPPRPRPTPPARPMPPARATPPGSRPMAPGSRATPPARPAGTPDLAQGASARRARGRALPWDTPLDVERAGTREEPL